MNRIRLRKPTDQGYCNYCRGRSPAIVEVTTDADISPRPVDRLCEDCLVELYFQAKDFMKEGKLYESLFPSQT